MSAWIGNRIFAPVQALGHTSDASRNTLGKQLLTDVYKIENTNTLADKYTQKVKETEKGIL